MSSISPDPASYSKYRRAAPPLMRVFAATSKAETSPTTSSRNRLPPFIWPIRPRSLACKLLLCRRPQLASPISDNVSCPRFCPRTPTTGVHAAAIVKRRTRASATERPVAWDSRHVQNRSGGEDERRHAAGARRWPPSAVAARAADVPGRHGTRRGGGRGGRPRHPQPQRLSLLRRRRRTARGGRLRA